MNLKQLRNADLGADSIGKTKRGTFVLRRGFFYRHGMSAEAFLRSVTKRLKEEGISAEVVDFGEVWKPFRGGASIANSSHWYVEVK